MISVHTTPEKFENKTIITGGRNALLLAPVSMRITSNDINMAITILAAILDLCLRKTRADKSRDYRDVIVFEKLRFQIPPFSRVFRKNSVLGGQFLRISVDGRPNCVDQYIMETLKAEPSPLAVDLHLFGEKFHAIFKFILRF